VTDVVKEATLELRFYLILCKHWNSAACHRDKDI
jgi:hypothetical protein